MQKIQQIGINLKLKQQQQIFLNLYFLKNFFLLFLLENDDFFLKTKTGKRVFL